MFRSFRIHICTRTPCKAAVLQSGLPCPQYSKYRQPECVCFDNADTQCTLKVHPLELPRGVSRPLQFRWRQGFGAFPSGGPWRGFAGHPSAWTLHMCRVGHGEWGSGYSWSRSWKVFLEFDTLPSQTSWVWKGWIFAQNNNLATDTLIYFLNLQTFKHISKPY